MDLKVKHLQSYSQMQLASAYRLVRVLARATA